MSSDSRAARHDDPPCSDAAVGLLRNRNFQLLWAAYAVSALGDHISETALLQMQDALSGDVSTRIGAVTTFGFMAPFFVLAPLMGWIADRWPRKWVMVAADLIRAGLMFGYFATVIWLAGRLGDVPFFHTGRVHTTTGAAILSPWLYTIPLMLCGVFAAMFSPCRAAMLPTLVPTDQLIRANALTNALGPLMAILSFILGAEIVQRYGAQRNFQVDAVTFLVSAVLILGIRPPPRRHSISGERGQLVAGFRYVRTHRRLIDLTIVATVFWIAASTVRSIVPAFVKDVIHGSYADIGYFQATLGMGILGGAVVLSVLGDSLRANVTISWALVGAGVSVLWLTLVSRVPALGAAACYAGLFMTGLFGAGVLVGVNALMQQTVPDRFRGRVISVNDFFSMGGLLLATGLLGIPEWPRIDRYVPLILGANGVMLLIVGVIAVRRRLRRSRFGPSISFWYNVNYLYCRLWHRVRREGMCTIPTSGPVIVAGNHLSSIDPLVINAGSPNRYVGFMIAREYYDLPLIGRIIKLIDCVPVNRTGVDTASIKAALRHLEQGKVLGIFPQGGIRDPAENAPPREGVGLLALRSGAPVVPAYVSGIEYSDRVLHAILRRQRAVVRYGPPVDLSAFRDRAADRTAYKEASERIFAAVLALRDNAESREVQSQPLHAAI